LFVPACYVSRKRIAGAPTNENEGLLHASFNIYSTNPNCYAFWSSFHDDNLGLTSFFHVIDTFYNSTSRYGPKQGFCFARSRTNEAFFVHHF
jgi:hypothetical protein